MKNIKWIFIAMLTLMTLNLFAEIKVNNIQLETKELGKADLKRVKRLYQLNNKNNQEIKQEYKTYLIKINLTLDFDPSEELVVLLDGKTIIPFGITPEGIYLKVYSIEQLKEWSEKTLVLKQLNKDGVEITVTLPKLVD